MGLLKAGIGALGGTLADQWKEFFYCDSLANDVLAVKGQKRVGGRSSNTKGTDNIISNGSVIAVVDGQAMMIVEQGKVVEFSAEPGEFIWDSSTEPSIFTGGLGKGILNTFKSIGKRFTFGGEPGKDQRVYYFNTKELLDNKFGSPTPIMFRVVDRNIGLDMDASLRCNGIYTYRIDDPLLFYANVCGNVTGEYKRSQLDSTLKTEFISALQPALARISELGIRPSSIPAHVTELCDAMNAELSKKWGQDRGLKVMNVAMNPITLTEEDAKAIKEAQQTAIYRDPGMGAANINKAQADAMRAAADNPNGAMMGFMGISMAQQAGGMNAADLYHMAAQQSAQPAAPDTGSWKCACGATATGKFCPECGAKKPEPKPASGSWKCSCGATVTGKFCPECGAKRPEAVNTWTCSCGAVNKGKFCPECGARKPAGIPQYRCDKCGWEPADPTKPPKFCPECGDPFDDGDVRP